MKINWKQYQKLIEDNYIDPSKNMSGKGVGTKMVITSWKDVNGNDFTPDFKSMNLQLQKKLRDNNNPIELSYKVNYKK